MHAIEQTIILDDESPIFSALGEGNKLTVIIETELSGYILACSKALTAISSSLEKARLALSLLDIKHLEATTTEEQSRSNYIELLIENTIIRVQSIYDRVLIFTNRLLDLGISNESINHELLVTNEKVKIHELDAKLKAIRKACNEYRLIRNTVIHHDRYTEEELNQLTLVINADHLSRQTKGKSFVDSDTLKEITQAYLSIKREDLCAYLNDIEQRINEFYDASIPVYNHYKQKMRPSNK